MGRRCLGIFWRILLFLAGGWCALAALLSPIFEEGLRTPFAAFCFIAVLAAMYHPRIFLVPAIAAGGMVLFLWFTLKPSNERDWRPELSRLAWAEIDGDRVIIHNVRDFTYRTENDFDEHYVTKTVRLRDLSELDVFASYWSGHRIAHIFVSFGFGERDFIAVSVEVRKTKHQDYSTVAGFFRNYELIYIVAEERDLVALRTKFREPHEDVYLYRLAFFKENGIKLFMHYLDMINSLVHHPRFYNTLLTNCTTQVLANAQQVNRHLSYDWRVLLSGYLPDYLYLQGGLDRAVPLAELKRLGRVNDRADDVSDAVSFSERIREGVPKPPLLGAPL